MPTPADNRNEANGIKYPTSAVKESLRSRLPSADHGGSDIGTPPPPRAPVLITPSPEPAPRPWRWHFLPAFWTISSVLSMIINVVLIIILLLVFQELDRIRGLQSVATELLGGLHTNFIKMDQATISSNIPVDDVVPLNIVVPVQATTRIRLAETAVIRNAHVFIRTGGLTLDSNAVVTLPAETELTVRLDFPLNVRNEIPINLNVPVRIPLRETELHDPFVGLREIVEPFHCLLQPNATLNGTRICDQAGGPTLAEPTPQLPTPVGTVIP